VAVAGHLQHFSFSDDLVREVLQGQLSVAEQTDVHARAADTLARPSLCGADRLVRLAYHARCVPRPLAG